MRNLMKNVWRLNNRCQMRCHPIVGSLIPQRQTPLVAQFPAQRGSSVTRPIITFSPVSDTRGVFLLLIGGTRDVLVSAVPEPSKPSVEDVQGRILYGQARCTLLAANAQAEVFAVIMQNQGLGLCVEIQLVHGSRDLDFRPQDWVQRSFRQLILRVNSAEPTSTCNNISTPVAPSDSACFWSEIRQSASRS